MINTLLGANKASVALIIPLLIQVAYSYFGDYVPEVVRSAEWQAAFVTVVTPLIVYFTPNRQPPAPPPAT